MLDKLIRHLKRRTKGTPAGVPLKMLLYQHYSLTEPNFKGSQEK